MKSARSKFQDILCCLTISAAFGSPVVFGQALEEIIVTAQKRAESIQDTPISIAAFDTEELQLMGVVEIGTVADYLVNVQIDKQSGSLDNYGYNIRGVGAFLTNLLNDSAVGVYLDGVYLSRSTSTAYDVVDLERIEVLRGPQGTLYGRNTIGGAINLITKKPGEEFGFKQKLTMGNRDRLRSNTTIDTGSLGNGVSAILSYNIDERGGLVNNLYNGTEQGEFESDAWRIALRWQPTDTFTADLTFDKANRDNNGNLYQISMMRPLNASIGGALSQQAAAYGSMDRLGTAPAYYTSGLDSFSDIKMKTLTLEWTISDQISLKYIGADREWEGGTTGTDFGSFPSDGVTVMGDTNPSSPWFYFGATGNQPVPAGTHVSIFYANRLSQNDQESHELQLIGESADSKLQYVLGLYSFEEQSYEDNPQYFTMPASFLYGQLDSGTQGFLCGAELVPGFGPCFGKDGVASQPDFEYGGDFESQAIFGQFTYSITEDLDLTLGIRYTEDDKKAFFANTNVSQGGIPIPAGTRVNADNSWSNTSGAVIANYAINEDMMVYGSISTGYRSGGYTPRGSTVEGFQTGFDEETVTSYELGIKADLFDSSLRINSALFYVDYEDKQVASFEAGTGGATNVIYNAGQAEITGLEIELTAQITDAVRLNVNYGHIDAEFDEFISGRLDPVSGFPAPDVTNPSFNPATLEEDIADTAVFSMTAENSASAVLSYDFPRTSWAAINARIEFTYRDGMVFHPLNVLYDATDDQTLLNARVTFSEIEMFGGNLTIAGWGRNLADEEHREWGIDFGGAIGLINNSYKELRSYGIDLIFEL